MKIDMYMINENKFTRINIQIIIQDHAIMQFEVLLIENMRHTLHKSAIMYQHPGCLRKHIVTPFSFIHKHNLIHIKQV